jgi:putative transposase
MKTGSKALRRGRVSIPNQIYHLTSTTRGRQPLFINLKLARALVQSLHKPEMHCQTLAYVVMPDHFHWLLQLDEKGDSISKLMQSIKTSTAAAARRQFGTGRIWSDGFYDRAIRREEDLQAVARYIIANPVRAGLVCRVGDYPHWDAIWV